MCSACFRLRTESLFLSNLSPHFPSSLNSTQRVCWNSSSISSLSLFPHSSYHMQQSPQILQPTMPTAFLRMFHLYHLLNSLLSHFLPKKIASLLPNSWLSNTHQPIPQDIKLSSSSSSSSSPLLSVTRMNLTELRHVFQMFDRNGDGQITKEELSESLENLGIYIPNKDLAAMIEKIDTNGDGCVDVGEFRMLYEMIMDEKDEEEDMREAFNVFDENGDGFISVEELRSVLGSLGLKQGKTVEDCRKMIRQVDVDGNGMVDFKEFKQMMRGGGFAALSSSS